MNKAFNWIKDIFIDLTSETCPYEDEDILVSLLIDKKILPEDLSKDKYGNYYYKIGESRTIFASHLDTACRDREKVTHVIDGDVIKTDKKTILGADDKAGVTILLWMIKNKIPGLYYFFIGEEVGCIGSGLASKLPEIKGNYDRIVSFDRRGTTSVITFQSSFRTCSDEFARSLATQLSLGGLSYRLDDTGVYTDSAEFASVIPECTNISVGYYNEHTTNESQNIKHLYRLAEACLDVKWESLPTVRDMSIKESKWYSSSNNSRDTVYRRVTPVGAFSGYDDDRPYRKGKNKDRWEEEFGSRKRTRRGGKNNSKKSKSRVFIGSGSDLIEVDKISTESDKYSAMKEKFLDDRLTTDELKCIKEQYLNMEDPQDQNYYHKLLDDLCEG